MPRDRNGDGDITVVDNGLAKSGDPLTKFFIAQSVVDAIVNNGGADLTDGYLSFRARAHGPLQLLRLSAGGRFLRVSGAQPDPHNLVGKVKDEEAIVALGGELYMTSVLLRETAYDVEPGFVVEPEPPSAALNATVLDWLRAAAANHAEDNS